MRRSDHFDRREFFRLATVAGTLPPVTKLVEGAVSRAGIVDMNCMFGPAARIKNAYTKPEDLLGELNYFGIAEALVYHSFSRYINADHGNDNITKIAKQYPRLYPCWVAYPDPVYMPDLEWFLELMRSAGVRVVRIFPGRRDPNSFGFSMAEWSIGPFLAALARHKVPLIVEWPQVGWEELHEIASRYPQLPLVIFGAHYGVGRQVFTLLRACPNVYFGLRFFFLFNGLENLVHQFGATRFVFEGGLPEREPSLTLANIYYSDIKNDERAAILHDNFKRLWRESFSE
jgi:predicted TIM-barrel fold metal-dependent hydrolase